MKSKQKTPPTPRQEIFDTYWYFASERQKIFMKRYNGEAAPWTNDTILQTYKFCNVFRAADRVSQYLIKIIINEQKCISVEDLLFQIVAFRFFSKIETWESLKKYLNNSPTLQNLADDSFEKALATIAKNNESVYTGAFILCATNAFGMGKKYLNHIELFKHMFFEDNFCEKALQTKSLKGLYELLHSYPLIGDFMAYQIAIDLNYSNVFNFSENEFTKAGPGALRGIKKVFEDTGDYSPEEVILWMVERQDYEFERLNLVFDGLFGRKIHAIDAQNLFCEVDKYTRKAFPDIKSNRSRIKTKFLENKKQIEYAFPEKWELKHS